jgi:WD40 repeat protein
MRSDALPTMKLGPMGIGWLGILSRLGGVPSSQSDSGVRGYEAFISYSHAADKRLAPALQAGLQRFAKPWYRASGMRVFRDETDLSVNPALWGSIQQALEGSAYFILLASPGAAASKWVRREVEFWLAHRGSRTLLIAHTDGTIQWGPEGGDFDWERTDALPPTLQQAYAEEPKYADFTWVREAPDLSLRNPRFATEVARLVSAVRNRPLDALIGDDVHQRRRMKAAVSAAFLAITVTAAVAVWQWRVAETRRQVAVSRQFAADAVSHLSIDPERSLHVASQAMQTYQTTEAEAALRKSLSVPPIRAKLTIPHHRHDTPTWTVAFTSDRKHVVAASIEEGTVKTLNLDTGQLDNRITSVQGRAFTNGDVVLTIPKDGGNALVWDAVTGSVRRVLQESLTEVTHVTFSPDNKLVLTSTAKKPGQIWNTATGAVQTLHGAVGRVANAHFSSDNQLLVTVSRPDWKARLWDPQTGDLIRDLPGHQSKYGGIGQVTTAQFSPDGNYIATACGFGAGCYLAPVFEGGRMLGGRDLNGDGIAEFDGTVMVWKRTGKTVDLLHELPIPDRVYGLAFDTANQLVATASGDMVARVWHISTGRQTLHLRGHTNWVWSVAFSQDSNFIATTGSHDHTARVWEAKTGREVSVLRGHPDFVQSAVFSPDDKSVLTMSDDGTARIFAIDTGRAAEPSDLNQVKNAPVVPDNVMHGLQEAPCKSTDRRGCWNKLVSSWDGKRVVSFNTREQSYATAKVWQADIGTLILQLDEFKDGVQSAAFSVDNRWVVLTDAFGNTARVWDTNARREVALIGHTSRVVDAAFSPDNACVVTVSEDGTARLWHTGTGDMMAILLLDPAEIHRIAFDASGKFVIARGRSNVGRVYSSNGCAPLKDLRAVAIGYVEQRSQ